MLVLLIALFGDPRAVLFARTLAALAILCPCAPDDAACPSRHQTVAAVIATVATEADDPERAAVLLLAAGAHETRFRTMRQVQGPAVTWWQLEVLERERAALLADPVAAARRALGIALRGWGTYACGDARRCPDAAAELRRYEMAARFAFR